MKHIRNFCIIAHIDHGKSTLADRLLDYTGAVTEREKKSQLLDSMDLERERGITIKSHAIQMEYTHEGQEYVLNLIDTPGHVDFSYEVSRSIAACEGALLIVDAAQSIQAQTISNLYLALDNDLEIIPVLNKVDLPSANPEEVTDDIVDLLGCEPEDVIHASGKTGFGVDKILEAIIAKVPAPSGNPDAPLKALIFDSVYNSYRGIETYFRVIDGSIKKNQRIQFMSTGTEYKADEVGTLKLEQEVKQEVKTGDVGYLITGIKVAKEVKVGDTITDFENPTESLIDGFEDVKPMVFAGIYPVDTEDYEELRNSMEKLQLNDASLVFQPESSAALGFGFRCGFLGMLHMEIIQERLEREFNMTVITTVPNVSYHAYTKKNPTEIVLLNNPTDLPDPSRLEKVEEPFIKASIITKSDFVGQVMSLCIEKRGEIVNQTYLTTERVELTFDMPLAEIVFDFYDRLKTVSKGYASFDYSPIGMRTSKLVRVDILLNGDPVDALSALLHADNAYTIGKKIVEKLKELIPRQQFDIPIQAAIGAKIIARETTKALRKDVTAKCYGGDISRKRKLLEKQKKGKKRMRQVGNVEIPQEAFMAVLKLND
ncbi:elongation factor 4 [Tenacibaculum finnmarkense genomovar finnmarkense]|uniref:translation elongation factor 4 n=1 Tax=Tenacibaculum finnmarkense TaxID=2781243 RepID=UPI00187B4C9F|nr:translation elongation factor 4 [Tenacibaculum finnmarkense]MBE7660133.1 elongation factor 4 [Tenacibaculum finnmarkense genomovar finnmarkense]MBE7692919.1 elongation factor 4 [Tenacibaculum finnmarkense genomovar finnmarkense]MCD8403116.1 translation elongation factor 4 [Tenacibaculum finnmarkense genomovar finnmarkense]MCD8411630.1 translation elongation factor 4 [Tenacibaculum finnmarkense genomovar ulcerans]MCD8416549.1 translation elongation factor 4 [Tenacibaculum finnmarkense genomo